MENTLYLITLTFLSAWFVVSFTPLHSIFYLLKEATVKYKLINFFIALTHTIISCQKCTAFWLGLLITGDVFLALISSFISYIYESKISI